ncbi:MAG: succinate dehydrogenase [Candidatus Binatus sp.]|uniref:succinate dehydrogenase n=1 Tax=Candidatus Binatus sp. TaxID=2811406 RepID=UPI002727AFBE|nr:succinate dehydrogenase [Candidatus Binatus sp.]MDO8431030.1 succinate dehydrogenase [Candidatus Binatus sp.]
MAEPGAIAAPVAGATMSADERHWLLRRLHSLSGIVPIGGFLLFHIFENAFVLRGSEVWWKETEFTRGLPFQIAVEAAVLWIPILYHAIYGLIITATAQPNDYPYARNYQYTMQRITGILAFLFIGFHVFSTRIFYYATGTETSYERMHSFMIDPVYLTIYVVGTLACVYHLTNGIYTFSITWGLAVGPRAQRMVNRACIALGLILAIASVAIMVAFRAPA